MSNKVPQVILGFIWVISSLMLVYYGWDKLYWIGTLVQDEIFSLMYWIGLIIMFFICGILPGYLLVISAFKEEN